MSLALRRLLSITLFLFTAFLAFMFLMLVSYSLHDSVSLLAPVLFIPVAVAILIRLASFSYFLPDEDRRIQFHLSTLLLITFAISLGFSLNWISGSRKLSESEVNSWQAIMNNDPSMWGGHGDVQIVRMREDSSGWPYPVRSLGFYFSGPIADGRTEGWFPPDPEDPEVAYMINFFIPSGWLFIALWVYGKVRIRRGEIRFLGEKSEKNIIPVKL